MTTLIVIQLILALLLIVFVLLQGSDNEVSTYNIKKYKTKWLG